jgi:nitroreductase
MSNDPVVPQDRATPKSANLATGGRADATPAGATRALRRVRQSREFAPEPLTAAEVDAVVDAARWSGSARNSQPWRFIVIRDTATLRRLAAIGAPQTRPLETAVAAVAVILRAADADASSTAYDEGRAVERALVAATVLGFGAGISWIRRDVRAAVAETLGLPPDRIPRTIVSLGHPSAAARRAKSAPGTARLPRSEVVFEERWPADSS